MMPLRFFLFPVLLTLLFSCQREDLSDLKDVLYVRRNQADMPAYIYGNGASKVFLIILHGGPGGSGLEYRIGQYSNLLEQQYAVVYWDQRGQGMSQGSFSKTDLSLAEMVEDVKALALVLRHKYGEDNSYFLMGHSWGGLLGSAYMSTADHQDLFKGWIEASGAHDFPEVYRQSVVGFQTIGREQMNRGNDVDFWEEVLQRINQVDTLNVNLEDFSYMNSTARTVEEKLTLQNEIASGDPEAIGSSLVNTLFINNHTVVNATGTHTNEALFDMGLLNFSVSDQLKNIRIPSLLLWGKNDLVVPVQLGYQAFDLIGSSQKELIVYTQSGHSPMVNEPQAFVADIIDFIETYK